MGFYVHHGFYLPLIQAQLLQGLFVPFIFIKNNRHHTVIIVELRFRQVLITAFFNNLQRSPAPGFDKPGKIKNIREEFVARFGKMVCGRLPSFIIIILSG